eukprot:5183441-Amphidinium_carterae.1
MPSTMLRSSQVVVSAYSMHVHMHSSLLQSCVNIALCIPGVSFDGSEQKRLLLEHACGARYMRWFLILLLVAPQLVGESA